MEDQALLALYLRRDEAAVRISQQQYGAMCFALAERILKNAEDAEECVADTWLRAWNVIPPDRPRSFAAYFAKITRNLAFDRWRAQRTRARGGETAVVLDELAECIPAKDDVEALLAQKLLRESIDRFLRTLPERDCSLFLLRYFYAMPLREIAARYSLRESAVKTSLFRTRKRLRKFLDDLETEESR